MKTNANKKPTDKEVAAYQKQVMKARAEFQKLSAMPGRYAEDAKDAPDPEKARWSKVSDIYENMTNYLTFVNEQIRLLDAAQNCEWEMPNLSWTFVELEKVIKKLMKLKEEWRTLSINEKEGKAAGKAA